MGAGRDHHAEMRKVQGLLDHVHRARNRLPCSSRSGSSSATAPNNLSGASTDATRFIATYLQGLQAIRQAWSYCDIIVSAIPPLDKQRENTNLTMTQVDAYNAALVQMCEEKRL